MTENSMSDDWKDWPDRDSPERPSARDVVIFCDAAKDGDIADVRRLLTQYGKNIIDRHDSIDACALTWAAFAGHTEIVKLLLENGANVDAPGTYNRPALTWAAERGHGDIVTLLLQHNANTTIEDEYGRIAVDYAHQYGREDIVQEIEAAPVLRAKAAEEQRVAEEKAAAQRTADKMERLRAAMPSKNAFKLGPK